MTKFGALNRTTQYLIFQEVPPPSGKTKMWTVSSLRHGNILGRIKWYGPWRQFVFLPANETIFNRGCLSDVEQFLVDAYDDWRRAKQEAKT